MHFVRELTNALNDLQEMYLWLIDWLADSSLPSRDLPTDQMTCMYCWLIGCNWHLLSGDWPTDWMIYGWLFERKTDSTVLELTK